MKIYYKEWEQTIPGTLDEIWHFFTRPENLDTLTPPDMPFHTITDLENKLMYEGMLIEYKVSPLLKIPLHWVTEITHVKDRTYFIDEQRFGPYTLWHHEHHFEETSDGVLMKDQLHYAMPLGFLGRIANAILVDSKVEGIFSFRKEKIKELFGIAV